MQVTRGARTIGFSCPYVHPIDDPARKRFLKDVNNALGIRGEEMKRQSSPDRCLSTYDLSKAPSGWSKSTTGILPEDTCVFDVTLLWAAVSTRHRKLKLQRTILAMAQLAGENHPTVASSGQMGASAGWGTGAAAFRQDKWRQPWRKFFEGFDDRIAIMTLPHHGSANNFHPDILGFEHCGSRSLRPLKPETASLA